MVVLGIDLGTRRIGLALSDPDECVALPAGTLESAGRRADLEALCALARERGVGAVVVGLPVHMNGRAGPEAEAARAFARELAEASGLPVETLDERWTTREADRALREDGRRGRKRRKQAIDAMAATLLLRTFLELRAGAARGRA